jgi:hypothetical protein
MEKECELLTAQLGLPSIRGLFRQDPISIPSTPAPAVSPTTFLRRWFASLRYATSAAPTQAAGSTDADGDITLLETPAPPVHCSLHAGAGAMPLGRLCGYAPVSLVSLPSVYNRLFELLHGPQYKCGGCQTRPPTVLTPFAHIEHAFCTRGIL